MINSPVTANSIVGFDIDKFIKGDLSDNRPPEVSAPIQLNQGPLKDTVNIKSDEKIEARWRVFGGIFTAGIVALISTPFIKKAIKTIKH